MIETDIGDITAKAHMQPTVIQDVDLNICQSEKKKTVYWQIIYTITFTKDNTGNVEKVQLYIWKTFINQNDTKRTRSLSLGV